MPAHRQVDLLAADGAAGVLRLAKADPLNVEGGAQGDDFGVHRHRHPRADRVAAAGGVRAAADVRIALGTVGAEGEFPQRRRRKGGGETPLLHRGEMGGDGRAGAGGQRAPRPAAASEEEGGESAEQQGHKPSFHSARTPFSSFSTLLI